MTIDNQLCPINMYAGHVHAAYQLIEKILNHVTSFQ